MGHDFDLNQPIGTLPAVPRGVAIAAEYLADLVERSAGTKHGRTALYFHLLSVLNQHAKPAPDPETAPELLEVCRVVWGMASEFIDDGPGVGRAEAADKVLRRIEEYTAAVMARAEGLAPSPDAGRGGGTGEEG